MRALSQGMNADSNFKGTLLSAVNHAVFRIENLKEPADRRCLFHEYKEWLGEEINNEVWAIPSDFGHQSMDSF